METGLSLFLENEGKVYFRRPYFIIVKKLVAKVVDVQARMVKDYEANKLEPNFTPLRELNTFCNAYLLETEDSFERIVAFLLAKYLGEVLSNFGVDAFFDMEIENARIKIYEKMLDSLPQIKKFIEEQNYKNMGEVFSELIGQYEDKVKSLNRIN